MDWSFSRGGAEFVSVEIEKEGSKETQFQLAPTALICIITLPLFRQKAAPSGIKVRQVEIYCIGITTTIKALLLQNYGWFLWFPVGASASRLRLVHGLLKGRRHTRERWVQCVCNINAYWATKGLSGFWIVSLDMTSLWADHTGNCVISRHESKARTFHEAKYLKNMDTLIKSNHKHNSKPSVTTKHWHDWLKWSTISLSQLTT